MRVVAVRALEVPLPLPRPIVLGPTRIETRDVVVLRLETEDGAHGDAIGYTRGTPLIATLERLAPALLGADPLRRGAVTAGLDGARLPGRGQMIRALSLVDVALWDLAAKAAAMPLHALLGGHRARVPVTAVAGYHLRERGLADVADEVARRFDQGFARVKVMLDGPDEALDAALIERLARPGRRLAVDAHWSFAALAPALRLARRVEAAGLDFLEDPFPASEVPLTLALQRETATPIAAGEDVFGLSTLDSLVRGVGLFRLDATTCGGIGTAIAVLGAAASAGRTVLPHVFPDLHVQLACAFPAVEMVEVIPEDVGTDPLHLVLRTGARLADGEIRPSDAPGAGFVVDWDAADRMARVRLSFTADRPTRPGSSPR